MDSVFFYKNYVGEIMTETIERKRTTRSRKQPVSRVDREIQEIDAYVKKISSSKEKAIAFLKDAGILDKKGELAKQYRN